MNEIDNDFKDLKENKLKNFMIVFLSIIVVLLAALLVYVAFFRDNKCNIFNGKNCKVKEKEEVKEVEISKELEDKIKYVVLNVPLSRLIELKNIEYNDIYESHVIFKSLDSLSSQDDLTKEEWEKTSFNYDEIYTYNGGHSKDQVKYYNGKDVVTKVKDLYNYELNLTSKEYGGCEFYLNGLCTTMTYDSTIDKFVVYYGGGTGGHVVQSTILNTTFNDNIYKINYVFVDYDYYEGASYCSVKEKNGEYDKEVSCSLLNTDEKRDNYAKENKDELPQYEVSFKINGDKYEFLDIKKVN